MINELGFDDTPSIDISPGLTVFFDMDGTLVDTDYANYLSYRRAVIEVTCGAHDVEFTGDRLNRESLKSRLPSLTTLQVEVIAELKAEYFMDVVSVTRLNTALAHVLTKFCGKNIIVLVTCCREKRAIEILKYHKLLKYFDQLICWEDLPQGRASKKYEIAIENMGVSQEDVLIFENDSSCIEEAVLAGVPTSNIYRILLSR